MESPAVAAAADAGLHGRIVEFRVMIRPLRAVNVVHEQMRTMLEQMAAVQT